MSKMWYKTPAAVTLLSSVWKQIKQVMSILFVIKDVKERDRNILNTDEVVGILKKGVEFGQLFGAHPLVWDDTTQLPALAAKCNKTRQKCWYINIVIEMTYYVYVLCRSAQIQVNHNAGAFSKTYSVFMLWLYAVGPLNSIALIAKGHLIPGYVADYTSLAENMQREYFLSQAKPPMLLTVASKFCKGIFYAVWGGIFCVLVYCAVYPRSPDLIFSMFLRSNSGNIFWMIYNNDWSDLALFVVSVMFQVYVFLQMFASSLVMINALIPAAFGGWVVCNELSSRRHIISKDRLRAWKNRIALYHQLSVLTRRMQDIAGFPVAYNKAISVSVVIVATYAMLSYTGIKAIGAGMFAAIACSYVTTLFYSIAALFHSSASLLTEWKQELGKVSARRRHRLKKALATLRPLKFKVFSGCYHVDKQMIVTMHQSILESIVNALMVRNVSIF